MNVSVERLRHLGKSDLAEELSGQYQGDIVLTPEQLIEYRRGSKASKTGLIDTFYRWRNNTVPYEIDAKYFSNPPSHPPALGAENLFSLLHSR
jgi:hypothetical protein